jgi:hypothetical protein
LSYFCTPSSSYLLRCHRFLFLDLPSSFVLLSCLVVFCIPSLLCLFYSLDLSSLLLFSPPKFPRFRLSLFTRLGIKQWSFGFLVGFFWRSISPSQYLYLPLVKLPKWQVTKWHWQASSISSTLAFKVQVLYQEDCSSDV